MTREEAINEIKSWAIPSEKGREVLETLIPELRENEDENLKNKSGYYKAGKFWKASTLWNATKNKVPQRVPNRYILQECTWNIGTLQQFADEVKNVQEVSLDYPIILDMNGNIIDGAHRVVKAYLEGKDIDIVYIGDDEWPEPDYDEEKAIKESDDERIINQLITLVNINSAAGEVLLIPTNKEELVAWLNKYKESLHIPETCKENADSFTAEEDGPFDEDEFLEDELSAFLQNYDKEYDDDAAVSDVARHFYEIGKKQNEQKSVPFSCGHENGKPADPDELDFQQEQLEENLEKEIKNYLATECAEDDEHSVS